MVAVGARWEVSPKSLPQARVSVMRSRVTPPNGEPHHGAETGWPDLPRSYGRTRVVALPIDPFHVHAYWEITEKDRLSAMKRLDPLGAHRLSWVLRFHDVSSGDARARDDHFDVFVDRAARNWYIELWSPGKRYWVELGTAFGARFTPVSRSGELELPRTAPGPSEAETASEPAPPTPERSPARAGGIAALSPPVAAEPPPTPGPMPSPPEAAIPAEPPGASAGPALVSEPREPRRAGPDATRLKAGSGSGERVVELAPSASVSIASNATSGSGGSGAGVRRRSQRGRGTSA